MNTAKFSEVKNHNLVSLTGSITYIDHKTFGKGELLNLLMTKDESAKETSGEWVKTGKKVNINWVMWKNEKNEKLFDFLAVNKNEIRGGSWNVQGFMTDGSYIKENKTKIKVNHRVTSLTLMESNDGGFKEGTKNEKIFKLWESFEGVNSVGPNGFDDNDNNDDLPF